MAIIKFKRGNVANLPKLQQGEPAFTIDTKKLYVGDGTANIGIVSDQDLVSHNSSISSHSDIRTSLHGKVDKVSGKGLSTNDYTTTEKNKLSGIQASAEVNQNAFSTVKVGSTLVSADTKTDTLEIVAGSNITITPDATNDKITIQSKDTVYTHPASGVTAGTYPKVTVNAQGHVTSGTSLTASDIPTLTASKVSDFDTQVRKSTLSQMAAPTTDVSMNSKKITGLATGTATTDAVNVGQMNVAINNASSGIASAIHPPVQNITECKAIIASSRMDKMLLNIEDNGLYRWDAQSTAVSNSTTVIRPNDITADTTAGRWVKMNSTINEHNSLDSLQGGTTGEYYHLTNAQLTKLNGVATGANNYVHPTSDGNKHIPSGGAANQYLKYSAAGTASWSALPSGTVNTSGIVQLNDAINSTSTTQAATANAVKKAVDEAKAYAEPKNSNIQTHISSAHAPSTAQKNSDITKAEIEAKLTGAITTHTHNYANSSGVSGIWKVGHTFYNVCNLMVRNTPTEILIKTKIKWISSNHMPTVHIKGYAYGQQSPVELKLGWYIYNDAIGYCGVVSMGSWRPTVKLCSYIENNIKYVGIALIGEIYYPQFTMDLYDAWDNNYSAGWTTSHKLKTDTGASIIPTTDLLTVPYKSTFSATINGVKFDGTSNITIKAEPTTHDHNSVYEPKNSNIQTHISSAHAPSTAQKNSDITKAEIEAKLTGAVTTHGHATLTRGTYLTGSNYSGTGATTWAVDATSANTASKVVARDASGNFSAGTITATLSGNASSATKLQTARQINGTNFDGTANITTAKWGTSRTLTLSGNVTGSVSIDGSANVNIATTVNGITREDLTGSTVDLNTYNLSSGTPINKYYIQKTTGGAANITNTPVKEPFLLDVELIRFASGSDYITKQTITISTTKCTYERFCTNGTWTSWLANSKFTNTPVSGQVVVADGTNGGIKTTGYTIAKSVPSNAVFTDTVYTHPNSGATAGTYPKVTVNAQGHVTYGTSLTVGDIPTLTASKISDFDTQVRKSTLNQMAGPTTDISMNSKKITGLATGTATTDAVNVEQLTNSKIDGGTF